MAQRPDQFTLNASHTLAQGLVFAGLGQIPGSTRYHDSSVFGNTGKLTNMDPATDWVPALGRYATHQGVSGGAGEYIEIPASLGISSLTALSIGGWQKVIGGEQFHSLLYNANSVLSARTLYSDNTGIETYWGSRTWRFCVQLTASPWAVEASGGTVGTSWTHVLGTFDASVIRLFINGNLVAENAGTSVSIQAFSKWFSGQNTSNADYNNFQSADLVAYNRAIPLAQVQQLADPSNVMLSGLINPPRRKWWPVAAGGTPATFKAVWAARRRQVIGGGIT